MLIIENIPIPFFILDFNYQILDYSDAASIFPFRNSFMDLVDKESQAKISKTFARKEMPSGGFEVNLMQKDQPVPMNYEIFFSFIENTSNYYVVCIPKKEDTKLIRHQMNLLREQLMRDDLSKFDQFRRKDWIQFFQPVLTDRQIANMLGDHEGLRESIARLERVQEQFGNLKPDIIESGKIESLMEIEEELEELKSTLDFYSTILPISKQSFIK
ncbi:hypothetical protein [Falsibacillus pallidus]|uniref:hypothetical protein n=1 Tax=Falsibacillus pallidus TaxID=493781 RepID=UPI003D952DFF